MKRGTKSNRRKLVAEADRVFSLWARARQAKETGHCEFCQGSIDHAFHYITRMHHTTRWDGENICGSCKGCNYRMEFDPSPFITHYIHKFGLTQWEAIVVKSHGIAKYSTADLEGMIAEYKGKLEEMK